MEKRLAAALIVQHGLVLLGFRSLHREFYPGVWDFIGGHCRQGESYETALRRELQEEINVVPVRMREYVNVDRLPDFTLRLFLVTAWEGEIGNADPSEHERVEWFTLRQASMLAFPDPLYGKIIGELGQQA